MSSPPGDVPLLSPAASSALQAFINLFRSRGFWVLVDQAVVSAGNFITAILLGRYLSQSDYGSFGMLLENMLLLNSLQAALIIYPYSVKSAGDPSRLQRLTSASMIMTLVIFPLLGVGMVGVAAVSGAIELAGWAIVSILFWQIQETLRRGLMADMRFRDTVWGDAIRYLGQTAAVAALGLAGKLTLGTALVTIVGSSLVASLLQAWQLKPRMIESHDLRVATREFWVLGRWALLTSGLVLFSGTAYMWVLKYGHGLEAVGAFVAIYSVMKLTHPLLSSATSLIQPAVARAYRHGGPDEAKRIVFRYSRLGLLLVPFYVFLLFWPELSMKLFYGWDTPYVRYGTFVRLYVISYTIVFINGVAAATLGGLEKPRQAFIAQLVNAILSVAIGLPMTWVFGLTGLILGGLVAITGVLVAHLYWLHRAFQEPLPEPPPEPRAFEVVMRDAPEERPLETGGPP